VERAVVEEPYVPGERGVQAGLVRLAHARAAHREQDGPPEEARERLGTRGDDEHGDAGPGGVVDLVDAVTLREADFIEGTGEHVQLPFRRLRAGWVELRFERLAFGVGREGDAEDACSTVDLGHDADHLRQVTLGKDAMGTVVDDTPLSVVLRFESEQKITSTEVNAYLNSTFVVDHLASCGASTALLVKVSESLA
jgi:hypothetical protein